MALPSMHHLLDVTEDTLLDTQDRAVLYRTPDAAPATGEGKRPAWFSEAAMHAAADAAADAR